MTPAGLDQLVSVSGGVLYVYGSGGARFFAAAGGAGVAGRPPAVVRGRKVYPAAGRADRAGAHG